MHFTVDYFPPNQLETAFAHWQFLNGGHGSYARSRMWQRAIAVPGGAELSEHCLDLFTADLRCEPWRDDHPHQRCACLGDLTYQAICEPCGWHFVAAGENAAVESWHDHALPGWRQLPIVPARICRRDANGRLSKSTHQWIAERYPEAMQFPGAPIVTERDAGTRHVPGRSPWGGYDLSHTAVDPSRPMSAPSRITRSGRTKLDRTTPRPSESASQHEPAWTPAPLTVP